jgi:hypothetical protein
MADIWRRLPPTGPNYPHMFVSTTALGRECHNDREISLERSVWRPLTVLYDHGPGFALEWQRVIDIDRSQRYREPAPSRLALRARSSSCCRATFSPSPAKCRLAGWWTESLPAHTVRPFSRSYSHRPSRSISRFDFFSRPHHQPSLLPRNPSRPPYERSSMKSTLRLALVLSALCFGALPARADVAPSNGGSCSIGKQSSATRAAPWLLAAVASSLFLIGSRRRR